jgi:hypothetical protein
MKPVTIHFLAFRDGETLTVNVPASLEGREAAEHAWADTQRGNPCANPESLRRLDEAKLPSTSVKDVFVVDGVRWVCAPVGFELEA